MHNEPSPAENLSELEDRLRNWLPTSDGCDADALLYAAGQASVRRPLRPLAWVSLACTMTVLCVALASWLWLERAERQALGRQLAEKSQPVPSEPTYPDSRPTPDERAGNTLIAGDRVLGPGLQPPAAVKPEPMPSHASPSIRAPILYVGQRNGVADF
jgi:hypothetical protein